MVLVLCSFSLPLSAEKLVLRVRCCLVVGFVWRSMTQPVALVCLCLTANERSLLTTAHTQEGHAGQIPLNMLQEALNLEALDVPPPPDSEVMHFLFGVMRLFSVFLVVVLVSLCCVVVLFGRVWS
jgi:hypothetical protein